MPRSSDPDSVTERIFYSGEWSDLTISTATRDFKVHKAIVCPASPFFDAACTPNFREARTGIIHLPESAKVMEDLLKHMYNINVPSLQYQLNRTTTKEDIIHNCDLHIAADKYQLDDLAHDASTHICDHLNLSVVSEFVGIGKYVFEHCKSVAAKDIRDEVVWETGVWMQKIMRNEAAWTMLYSCPEYMKLAMQWALDNPELVEKYNE